MVERKILFISKSDQAASTRYRALCFFSSLSQAGWTPLHRNMPKSLAGWRSLLQEVRSSLVTVLLRRLPGPVGRRQLRKAARHLVFDFDDAIDHGTGPMPSPRRQRRFAAMVGLCDQVWAGNGHLAEKARAFNGKVHRLPTSVNPSAYAVSATKPTDHLDLVWIGSASTRPYLEQQVARLGPFAEACPEARLKIVADFDLPDAPLSTCPVPWQQSTEAEALASSHIGLAPMPDNAWTRGKCGCKVLQYMAASLPVVASDVPIHREIVAGGGFLVRDDDGWLDALNTLHEDAARRSRMGREGHQRLLDHYAQGQVAEQMGRLLESAVG